MAQDDFRREIDTVANRFSNAVARKALPELLETVTDDVVFVATSGAPVVGREAVRALYTGLFARFDIRNTASPSDFEVEVVGNTAIVCGHDSMTLTLKTIKLSEASQALAEYAAGRRDEVVMLTEGDKPVA